MRSKKQRFAFQRFTETPTATPSTLGFGITHQPHEGGDGAKSCGLSSLPGGVRWVIVQGKVCVLPTQHNSRHLLQARPSGRRNTASSTEDQW
jgi:hypothetical protein